MAARALGGRIDAFLELLGRVAGWGWGAAGVVVLVWTYPRHLQSRVVAGVVLDDHLAIWLCNLALILLLLVIGMVLLYALRTVLYAGPGAQPGWTVQLVGSGGDLQGIRLAGYRRRSVRTRGLSATIADSGTPGDERLNDEGDGPSGCS